MASKPRDMSGWPTFRRTSGLLERICEHGVGHPDPDSLAEIEARGLKGCGVHGCDGCCSEENDDGE